MQKYRPEIDGLRTWAVLPVVASHLEIPGFQGGFVGVDVFFVISGYLITTILLSEIAEGQFSIVNFYERRARRIFPALAFLIICVTPIISVAYYKDDLAQYLESIIWVVFSASNIFFWARTDYFAVDAGLNPLLHTWSLGIEEQYYVVFPLILLGLSRLPKRFRPMLIGIGVIFLLSLGVSIISAVSYPVAGYFLLPARAWELMTGGICAVLLIDKRLQTSGMISDFLSALGLVMIVAAIVLFDEATPFPGYAATLPVLGASLIILYSGCAIYTKRMLSLTPIVIVGLMSYSIYLWHQPVIALLRYKQGDLTPTHWVTAAVIIGLMSYISWQFIEKPTRSKANIGQVGVFTGSAIAAALIVAIAIGAKLLIPNSTASSETAQIESYLKYKYAGPYRSGRCFLGPKENFQVWRQGCIPDNPRLVVWGDSHAAALYSGFSASKGGEHVGQITASGCPPVVGFVVNNRPLCAEVNEAAIEQIKALPKPTVIVLAARWPIYSAAAYESKLIDTIKTIQSSGHLVYLFGPTIDWGQRLPKVLLDLQAESKLSQDGYVTADLLPRMRAVEQRISVVAAATKATFVSILDQICNTTECKAFERSPSGLKLFTWDGAHLTPEGAAYVLALRGGNDLVP